VIAATAVFFAPAGFTQGAPAAKAKYLEINPAQPTEPGKIEVLEFFPTRVRIAQCLSH